MSDTTGHHPSNRYIGAGTGDNHKGYTDLIPTT